MLIPNKYKDKLRDLIDNLDIECLVILSQIDLPSNNIPDSKNDLSDLDLDDDLLDRS